MTDLLIRNVEPKLKRELEKRARANGRSLSEEAKILLEKGTAKPATEVGFGTRLFSMLPDEFRGDDLVFEVDEPVRKPPEFE